MKINLNIQNLFKKLKDDDVVMSKRSACEDSIDVKKIKQETLRRVQGEKRDYTPYYPKKLLKIAMVAVAILCIGGGTGYAAANEEVRTIISELLGISNTEVLTIGESVQNKDYKLTVIDIASDTNMGWITVSVEAVSESSKVNFANENFIAKFGRIGDVGYGLSELNDLETENIRYFSFEFQDSNKQQDESELVFSLEGIDKSIQVKISQTTKLEKVDNTVSVTKEGDFVLYDMEYSELGFTINGKLPQITEDGVRVEIILEFLDGTMSELYQTTISNWTEYDEKWLSGSSTSMDEEGNYVGNYTFSKKMDWSNVKIISINGTELSIRSE